MEYTKSEIINSLNYKIGLSIVEKEILKLENTALNDEDFEKIKLIKEQNFKIKIKNKTYLRCKVQLIICTILIIFCLFTVNYTILIFTLIFFISSLSGLITNRLTKNEKAYIKS